MNSKINDIPKFELWTDGSCWHVDKTGGWAFCIVNNNKEIYQDFGNEFPTTISRMELKAVLHGLLYLKKKYANNNVRIDIDVYSDSAFVVNCFLEKWYIRWRETEWDGVKNADLWRKLLDVYNSRLLKVRFNKVKGHSGLFWNDVVDFYAGSARKILSNEIKV